MMRMVRMQRRSHGFVLLFLVVFISGMVLSGPSAPRRSRVRRQNMKVRINATGDTIVMKFLLPNTDTKLEGYILGYGSSMFSKQFIQLPEDGKLYETEFDAEPKYLIAVQPVQTNEVKKKCTGKVDLEKPLHLVIGSVSPTSVVLSWGTLLKTSYQGNIMNDCLEDGHYTVRYREKNRKWNYQTCPTKDTVIDNLKPNTVYEFGVQPSSKDGTGVWSKPVIHNVSTTAIDEKTLKKIFKRPVNPPKPQTPGPHTIAFSPRHVHLNRTQGRQVPIRNASPKTTLAPSHTARQKSLSTPGPRLPVVAKQPIGREDFSRSVLPPIMKVPLAPKSQPSLHITTTTVSLPVLKTDVETHGWPALFQTQKMPHSQPHIQTRTHPHPELVTQKHFEPIGKHDSQSQTEKTVFQSHPQPQAAINPYPMNHPHQQPQPTFHPQLQTPKQLQPKPEAESVTLPLQTQPQIKQKTKPKSIPRPHSQNQEELQTKQAFWDIHHMHSQTSAQPQFRTQPQQPQATLLPNHWRVNLQQPKPNLQSTSAPKLNIQPLEEPEVQPKPTFQPIHWTKPQPGTKFATKEPHWFRTQSQPPLHTKQLDEYQPQTEKQSRPVFEAKPLDKSQSQTIPQPETLNEPLPPHIPTFSQEPQTNQHPRLRSTFKPEIKANEQPQPETILQPEHQHDPQPQPTFQSPPKSRSKLQPKPTIRYQTQQPRPGSKRKPLKKPQSPPTSQPKTLTEPLPPHKPRFSPEPLTNQHPRLRSTLKPEIEASELQPQPETRLQPRHPHDQQPQPTFQPPPKSRSELQPKPTIRYQTQQPRPGSNPKHWKKPQSQPTSQPKTLAEPQSQPQPTFKSHLHTQQKTRYDKISQGIPPKKFTPQTKPQTTFPTRIILPKLQSSFQPKTENEPRTHYKPTFPPMLKRPNEPLPERIVQYHPLNDSKSGHQQTFLPKGQPEQQPILETEPKLLKEAQPQIKPISQPKPLPQPTPQNEQIPQPPQKFQPNYQKELPQTLKPEQMQTTFQTILQTQSQPRPRIHETPQSEPRPQPVTHPRSLPEHPQSQPISQPESRNESPSQPQTSLNEPHLPNFQTTVRLKTHTQPRLRTTPQPKPLNKPPPRIQSTIQSQPKTNLPIFQPSSHNEPKCTPTIYTKPQTQPKSRTSDPEPLSQPPSQPDIKPPLQLQTEDQSQAVVQPKDHQEPYAQPQPTLQAQPKPLNEPQLQITPSSILKPSSPSQQFSQAVIHEPPQPKPILEPKSLNKSELQPHPTIQSRPHIQQQPQPKPISQPILQPKSQSEAQSETKPTLPSHHQTEKQPPHHTKFQRKPTEMAQHHQATTTPVLRHQPETQQSLQHILPNNPNYQHLPHPTSQPIPTTHLQSRNYPKTHYKLEPQTASTTVSGFVQQQKQYIKHQVHPQTQEPDFKTQTEHLTVVTHRQTPHATFKYIPQTQPPLLRTLGKSQQNDTVQIKGEQNNNPKPKKIPKKPPKTQSPITTMKHTSQTKPKGQQKPKEKKTHQPKDPKTQHPLPPNEKTKPPPKKQQSPTEMYIKLTDPSKSIYQLQPSSNTHSPLEPLPKPYPGSRLKPQPHPGVPIQPLNWTLSEPTKLTPLQAVPTAPSPPEGGKPLPRPALAAEKAGSYNQGSGILRSPIDEVPQSTVNSSSSPAERSPIKPRPKVQTHSGHNNVQPFSPSKTLTTSLSSSTPRADGEPHKAKTLPKAWSKENPGKDKTTMFLLVFLIH
ncbi:uncharacterized protein LOC142880615 isoform X1 [Nelusetta ayraudi]|uniref:uncharacterized protein LOC142880615 isoform X1 n=1 Tax=Nelusetta ayraudi TaxID=303726 RepID=UPI003F726FAE